MSINKTFYRGESITLGFAFPENYDLARIELQKVAIGSREFALVLDGRIAKCQLTSEQTKLFSTTNAITLWLDDTILGVKKLHVGSLCFGTTNATASNQSANLAYDILFNLIINETIISFDGVFYDLMKGGDGAQGRGILSHELISSNGLVDNYLITYTDNSTFNYGVTNGRNGDDGASAYEQAVAGGYVGTLEQFTTDLNSIQNKVDKVEGSSLVDDAEIAKLVDYPLFENLELTSKHKDLEGKNEEAEFQHVNLSEESELETVTDTTKIAASDSAFLKWFSGLTIYTYIRTKLLTVANTWASLQTFTSGLKTTKIIPNSDTTGVVIRNAADNADVVKVDTVNNRLGLGVTPLATFHGKETGIANSVMLFESISSNAWIIASANSTNKIGVVGLNDLSIAAFNPNGTPIIGMALERTSPVFGALQQDVVFYNSISSKKIAFRVNNAGNQINPFHILSNGGLDHLVGKFNYSAASPTVDTINDIRTYNNAGVLTVQKCTVANAIKGNGTWVSISNQSLDNTTAASSAIAGATRYRTSGTNSYCEMCMQTGASTYAWVIIKQNTW